MNTTETNLKLKNELKSEMLNTSFIQSLIPLPIAGNKYEIYRADAPFYCLSSKKFIIDSYASNPSFRDMMNQMVDESQNNNTLITTFNNELYVTLATFAKDNIKAANGGFATKEQLINMEEVAYHISILVYVAINVSPYCRSDYNRVFVGTWNNYYTNDILG